MNLTALLAVVCAIALTGCALLWNLYQAAHERAEVAEAAVQAALRSAELDHANAKKELEIARAESATRAGLQRVCHQIRLPVSSARPHDPARADPADGQLGQLAGEVIACRRNAQRLTGLQQWVRVNGG